MASKNYTGTERLGIRPTGEGQWYLLADDATLEQAHELVSHIPGFEVCRVREYTTEAWNRDAGQFGRVWRNEWAQV